MKNREIHDYYYFNELNFEKQNIFYALKELKEMNYSIWEYMEEKSRQHYKFLLETLLEAEREEIIEERRKSKERKEWIYKNSYSNITITTKLGSIEIKRPRLRKKYRSDVLPQYNKNEESILKLISDLYVCGVSTRKMEKGLQEILGHRISAGQISVITNRAQIEIDKFHKRKISDNYVYLYLDGIPIKAKGSQWENKKGYMILFAYGITENGIKELIDFIIVRSESNENCSGFIFDLYERGLKGKKLKLIITDGCVSWHNAIEQIYPRILRQRCWVHKLRNVAGYIGHKNKKAVLDEAKKIYLAKNKKEAVTTFKYWKKKWGKFYPKAVNCIEKDLTELLNFFLFPKEHRIKIRTTNPIERVFREFKRRTKVMDNYLPNINSCEKIFFALTNFINDRWKFKKVLHFPKIEKVVDFKIRREIA